MNRCFLLMCLVLLAGPLAGRAAAANYFEDGLVAAKSGNASEAVTLFEKELKEQPAAGVYLDLGIVEWQQGHAGAAILAWERATWIDPFDARAAQNLKFARALTDRDEPELRWYEQASTWLAPDAWVLIAGASLWLAVGALVLPRVFRWRKSGWHQTLSALGCCVFLFSLTANIGVVTRTDIGFVLRKNAPVLLTPTSGGEVISTLQAGEPVRRLKVRGDYFYIRTAMNSGWIPREQVGLISE